MVQGLISLPFADRSPPSDDDSSTLVPQRSGVGEFLLGSENQLAAAAICWLADEQASAYSPLVFYGSPGTGKSHVALGLVDRVRHTRPDLQAMYVTGADFAREFAESVDRRQLTAWRDRCRGVDLFVLDDVSRLAAKRGAQQELRHTIEALNERGAMIVVTSSVLPARLSSLSAGLRSRLSAGLAVPLLPPAAGTRRALIQRIAKARSITLAAEVIDRLAEKPDLAVPAIVGALMQIEIAELDTSEACATTNGQAQHSVELPSLREIAQLTAKYYGLKVSDLRGPLRRQGIVRGRYVAMYLGRELARKSLQEVGKYFGGRDHTTVLHGCRQIEKLANRDLATRNALAEIRRMLLTR